MSARCQVTVAFLLSPVPCYWATVSGLTAGPFVALVVLSVIAIKKSNTKITAALIPALFSD